MESSRLVAGGDIAELITRWRWRRLDVTQTVRPVTARVTFCFDANGRLNTIEMVRIPNQAIE